MTTHDTEKEPLTILESRTIFRKLIPQDNDFQSKHDAIIGKLAYTQYVIQKYQFIEKSRQDDGEYPGEAKMETIISFFGAQGDALANLKASAEAELTAYSDELLYRRTEEIVVKHKSFWGAVFASMTGAFLYSIIIALVIFSITIGMPNTKIARISEILLENTDEYLP
jgi:hypothetical protein